MSMRTLLSRGGRAWQRRAARWFGRRPYALPHGRPIISFTFDDFPRSALLNGGAILQRYGVAGTYYTSLGLAGETTACGEMFETEQLPDLLELGHELGCHTYEHCPAWETSPARFEAGVVRNIASLNALIPGASFRTLSYPISYPRPNTKNRVAKYFTCCRGSGQTFNRGTVDLNYLAAFFIEQSVDRPEFIRQTIIQNAAAGGWLIFATHDVCANPTRFGCTPELFRDVVSFSVNSGAEILPVAKALDTLRSRARFSS
jgi:peptidoglycan/xylan/chitin deacetylase (PgdA/CDA1 family)